MGNASGWALWLTGLPASGKTTIAWALQHTLEARGISAIVIDSDALRALLLPNSTYTPAERDWLYHRLVELTTWLVRSGENVIIAATGSQRRYREAARAVLGVHFAEVWVRCPAAVCQARDPKGLYASASAGLAHNLPGVGAAYEPPEHPDAVVDSDRQTPDQAAEHVLAKLPFLSARWPAKLHAAMSRSSEYQS